jgi:eukaryotic-like serine/threonine-protein kinase
MEATALQQGSIVDRFTVEALIGEGGMAMVFRVRHNVLGTHHALKVLTLTSPQIRARLEREGQLQASMRHPNVVAVTDVLEIGGSTALVLELIDGPPLDAVLRARRLTLEEIDLLVPGILAGVAAAHHHGYVHRDLKPANVLLARTGTGLTPKVTDFGLAKVAAGSPTTAPGSGARTRTGSTMGTPQYMSPEQVRDTKSVGPASDVFALGAILYEMVTGRRAFDGPDLLDIFNAVATGRYTPVAELAPDAPDRVIAAIDAALRTDPADRPTVVELAALWGADLEAAHSVAMSLPTVSAANAPKTPETWTSAASSPSPSTVAPTSAARTPAPAVSRVAWALGLGTVATLGASGALVLGMLAVGGWWWSRPAAPVVVTVPVPVAVRPETPGPPQPQPLDGVDVLDVLDVMDVVADPGADEPIPEVPPIPLPGAAAMHTREEAAPPQDEDDEADRDDEGEEVLPGIPELQLPAPVAQAPDPDPEAPAAATPPQAFGMLASEDPDERIVAAENLANRISDPDAPARLLALVQADPDAEVRRVASDLAIELYLDAHRDLEPAVVWVMRNGPEGLAIRAVEAYRAKGADPRELAGALAHPVTKVRLQALKALPVVAPRTPSGVVVDYAAMLGPLCGEDQPPALRRLAEDVLARL